MRREFSAGGVVVRRMRGRWWAAVVRPRREHHRPQVWALPKGLIDEGERGLETAIREVYEETGLHARGDRKLGDVRYVYTWRGVRVFKIVSFYLVRYAGGRLGAIADEMRREVAEVRWLPLADAERLLAYRGEREMAGKAGAMIRERCPPTR
jgi:8-oxo-dGTP pyrophosphatase MutT (NUDIX family)